MLFFFLIRYLNGQQRMESRGTVKIPGAESSETTIEIKIKTLDSQTYTLRVDKQVTSGALLSSSYLSCCLVLDCRFKFCPWIYDLNVLFSS